MNEQPLKQTVFQSIDARQADWSFLLPLTKESRVLRSIAALTDVPEEPTFDIIAVPDPSGEPLNNSFSRIFARLKKGGYAYLTIKNRWKIPGFWYSLSWMKKQLNNAGFSEITAYAVLPSPRLPIFFIPVDCRAAIQYFFHHLSYLLETAPVETKQRYRLPYFVIRVIIPILPSFLLSPLIRWFSPYFAFVAKKEDGPLVPREKRFCSGHHYLMMSGSIEGGTLTAMVFSDRSTKPEFVLRILRDETQLPQFLQERDILKYFQTLSPVLRDSVPRLQSCEEISGRWTLRESVMNGIPMSREADIDLVLPWLIALAKETRKPCVSNLSWESVAAETIAEYQIFFPASESEKQFFEQLFSALRAHTPLELPMFLVHGDFSRHNLFIDSSGHAPSLQVIDWMSARWSLFPFHDLCLFLTSFHLHSRKKSGIEGYLEVFEKNFFLEKKGFPVASHAFGTMAKDLLSRYALALKFDPKLIPFFFGFFLIEQAVLEARRRQTLEGRGVLPQRAVRDIFPVFFQFFAKNQSTFIVPL